MNSTFISFLFLLKQRPKWTRLFLQARQKFVPTVMSTSCSLFPVFHCVFHYAHMFNVKRAGVSINLNQGAQYIINIKSKSY